VPAKHTGANRKRFLLGGKGGWGGGPVLKNVRKILSAAEGIKRQIGEGRKDAQKEKKQQHNPKKPKQQNTQHTPKKTNHPKRQGGGEG